MTTIGGSTLRTMLLGAAAMVENKKQQLNDLNVFPVPDGDTGTNMSMTLNAAAAELRKLNDSATLTKVADTAASAMLRGARGNSGVILSLLFRGFSKKLKGMEECDGLLLAAALKSGVEAAYKAVMKPTEGTILTVSRVSAADAEATAAEDNSFRTVLEVTVNSATTALAETMYQNPVLEKAGVVDAGGKGWLLVLEAMLAVCDGQVIEVTAPATEPAKEQADFSDFNTEDITFQYCTEFIISRENQKDPENLRAYLATLGDSLVLVDDDEIIKVHVHTNDPGKAMSAAIEYGSFVTVKVENMKLQHTEKVVEDAPVEEAPADIIAPPEKRYGMVSVCAGEGLANIFRELGADNIIQGGQTMNPSTEDILQKINATPAEVVFVFPNNKNIIMAAQQTVGLTEKKVIVVPSKTIPQGVSAMLTFDPDGDEESNLETMTAAMGNVTTIQLTYAARNSDFDGHKIRAGEYLALYGGALFGSDKHAETLLKAIAKKLAKEQKEFITVFYGEDTNESDAEAAAEILRKYCTGAEVSVLNGGQPVYYYLISAE
ncbi:MAG: DAK2 domain-containing protein [Oscillospiraceae bacterium]|nr:DAK2 domain-containing protein [Oscillospiraceae bacterium]